MNLLIVAAAALFDPSGRILIAQRPEGKSMAGLWEFPGGKLEPGETPEAALVRELREELDVVVSADDLTPLAFASHSYPEFHLLMPLFAVRKWQGTPRPVDVGDIRFVTPSELDRYAMPAADAPLVRQIQTAING